MKSLKPVYLEMSLKILKSERLFNKKDFSFSVKYVFLYWENSDTGHKGIRTESKGLGRFLRLSKKKISQNSTKFLFANRKQMSYKSKKHELGIKSRKKVSW